MTDKNMFFPSSIEITFIYETTHKGYLDIVLKVFAIISIYRRTFSPIPITKIKSFQEGSLSASTLNFFRFKLLNKNGIKYTHRSATILVINYSRISLYVNEF